MERVLVIGCCGTGKSTISLQLHKLTQLPLIHLDRHFFSPDWGKPPEDEWQETVAGLIEADRWIIDGNFGGTMEMRMKRADTIVWLDLPRYVCMYRILKRTALSKPGSRTGMAEGCDERFDWDFVKYVWNFKRSRNPRLSERIERHRNGRRVIRLQKQSDIDAFLESEFESEGL